MDRLMTLEESMVYLECLIINELNPIYFQVDYQQDLIYLFIACDYFKHYTISERIDTVFSLLKFDCPAILKQFPVAVEAFDSSELDELFKMEKDAKQINKRKK